MLQRLLFGRLSDMKAHVVYCALHKFSCSRNKLHHPVVRKFNRFGNFTMPTSPKNVPLSVFLLLLHALPIITSASNKYNSSLPYMFPKIQMAQVNCGWTFSSGQCAQRAGSICLYARRQIILECYNNHKDQIVLVRAITQNFVHANITVNNQLCPRITLCCMNFVQIFTNYKSTV